MEYIGSAKEIIYKNDMKAKRLGLKPSLWKHTFKRQAKIYGLEDGSVLIKPVGKYRLWGYRGTKMHRNPTNPCHIKNPCFTKNPQGGNMEAFLINPANPWQLRYYPARPVVTPGGKRAIIPAHSAYYWVDKMGRLAKPPKGAKPPKLPKLKEVIRMKKKKAKKVTKKSFPVTYYKKALKKKTRKNPVALRQSLMTGRDILISAGAVTGGMILGKFIQSRFANQLQKLPRPISMIIPLTLGTGMYFITKPIKAIPENVRMMLAVGLALPTIDNLMSALRIKQAGINEIPDYSAYVPEGEGISAYVPENVDEPAEVLF